MYKECCTCGRKEKCIHDVWWRDLKEIYHLEDLGGRRKDNIKKDLQEVGWRGIGLMTWLRIGTGGERL
jgi:hypothetical protein